MIDVIIKNKTQILTPTGWELLREKLSPKHQRLFDALLMTGMRISEFKRLLDSPEWFKISRRVIDLPKGSILKIKCKQDERTVLLSIAGADAVYALLQKGERMPSKQSVNPMLKLAARKAGIPDTLLTEKSFRKTWISWLMAAVPERRDYVALSSGHDLKTMHIHYLSIGFSRDDLQKMRRYIEGWGT